jgi:pimeloyl-ACP methyl ester carboxylesterase
MEFPTTEFKLVKRGFDKTLVLIPGWATDYRIFEPLEIEFNYLLPVKFFTEDFSQSLLNALDQNNLTKVSLLGWSMGAFLASEFLCKYPQKVSRVFMVSAKEKYQKNNLEKIEAYLRKSQSGYLYKFYQECFCKEERDVFSWFKRNLLKKYLSDFSLDWLVCSLSYLSSAELSLKELIKADATFIQGQNDRIVPPEDFLSIKKAVAGGKFICLQETGHMPFLRPDFKKIVHEAL